MSETVARVGENFRASDLERRTELQQLQREETQHLVAKAKADAQLIASLAGRKIADFCGVQYSNDHVLSTSRERYVTIARRWTLFILAVHPDASYSINVIAKATGAQRSTATLAKRQLRLSFKDGRYNQTVIPLQQICDQLARLGWKPFDVRSAL